MKSDKIIIALFILLLIVNISALATAQDYEPHKKDTDLEFSFTSNAAVSCNVTIGNTPSGIVIINQSSQQSGQTFNNTIFAGNFSELGNYCYNIECSDGSTIEAGSVCREVTYLGKQLSEGQALMYLGFLTLLVLVFVLNFIGMGFLPAKNTRDEEGRMLSISYMKYFRNILWMTGYFLFIGIAYVSSNLAFGFLEEELIANTLFLIFRISFMFAPIIVIVWLIWIFVSMFHDKQFQRMLNRGVFPGSNL